MDQINKYDFFKQVKKDMNKFKTVYLETEHNGTPYTIIGNQVLLLTLDQESAAPHRNDIHNFAQAVGLTQTGGLDKGEPYEINPEGILSSVFLDKPTNAKKVHRSLWSRKAKSENIHYEVLYFADRTGPLLFAAVPYLDLINLTTELLSVEPFAQDMPEPIFNTQFQLSPVITRDPVTLDIMHRLMLGGDLF